jgi:hypothetical protein
VRLLLTYTSANAILRSATRHVGSLSINFLWKNLAEDRSVVEYATPSSLFGTSASLSVPTENPHGRLGVMPRRFAPSVRLSSNKAPERQLWLISARLKPKSSRWWKALSVSICLSLCIAVAAPAEGQESGSVADAARANRAKHERAAQASEFTELPPQPPLSETSLLAWQIAGMTIPDLLNTLAHRGICFPGDDAHLNLLRNAGE